MSFFSFLDIRSQRALYYARQAIPFLKRVGRDVTRTRRLWRRRRNGTYRYTVVSAAYNVAPYLDEYFRSLAGQILNFERHIQVILVDDGSTDDTAAVIQRWRKRYPHNITYIHKENGGQGSARNLGMSLARTPWVTFIDPDDFVDVAYFSEVDAVISRNHHDDLPETHIQLLGCNYIFYQERSGRFWDEHYLRGRFTGEERFFPYADMDDFIHLSVNSAFFRTAELERQAIRFDERRWPTFEDAHFIARYLQGLASGNVALARSPRYYYRKRKTGDSSLDTAPHDKRFYCEQMREAVLELLERSSAAHNGTVPRYVQRIALSHLWRRLRNGMNSPAPLCLKEDEAALYLSLLRRCFAHITPSAILAFSPFIDWSLIVGMLHFFKNTSPPAGKVFLSRYDARRGQLCLTYHTGKIAEEQILQNGKPCAAYDAKTSTHTLGDTLFCLQRHFWVDMLPEARLEVRLDGAPTRLVLNGNEHASLTGGEIEDHFAPPPLPFLSRRYARAWVFADRDIQADDNAEHLYRHIKQYHPEREIYFALRETSHDWTRLEREGFALLRTGGLQYNRVLRGCSLIISSHPTNPLMDQAAHKPFVFLQHGVTKDNISNWLNAKKLDLVLTATRSEYDAFVEDGSPYALSARETRLTGFPRHDALVPFIGGHDNMLLVMPTWRKDLLGSRLNNDTRKRRPLADFRESRYARCWRSFLASETVRRLAEERGMRIVFFPHADMRDYIPSFDPPGHVTLVSHADGSIQELFRQATVLVTDYSSVAFEMAFLKKPVLYYQFDRESIFAGTHTTLKGYFDYARDGFGPVAEDEEALLAHLASIVRRGGAPEPEYLKRMEDAFPFRDGQCCERAYRALEESDAPARDKPGFCLA